MKNTLLITFIALAYQIGISQSAMSLEQCVEYANQHQATILNSTLDQEIAEQKIRQTYTQLYPQVKGILDVRDNLILPTNILPGTIAGRPADETIALQFGQQYNATAALDANWILYDPSVGSSVKSLRQSNVIAQENTELQKRNLRYSVSKAYYGAVLAAERIKLQEELLAKYKKAKEDAQTLSDNQQLAALDVHRAEWNVKNQEAEILRAKQSYEQSLYSLKYQMGCPADSVFQLSDPIVRDQQTSEVSGTGSNVGNRSEYKILKLQQQQEQIGIRKLRYSYLPSLNAYGYLGTQSFRPEFDFLSSSASWYGISYIGLKLSVPVFDGLLKNRQVQESKILEEKKSNEISAFEKQHRYETENLKRNVSNSIQLLEVRKNNLAFAQEQSKQTEVRYQEGLSTYKEFVDASALVSEAQNSYLSAYHDYLVATLEYQKISY